MIEATIPCSNITNLNAATPPVPTTTITIEALSACVYRPIFSKRPRSLDLLNRMRHGFPLIQLIEQYMMKTQVFKNKLVGVGNVLWSTGSLTMHHDSAFSNSVRSRPAPVLKLASETSEITLESSRCSFSSKILVANFMLPRMQSFGFSPW